MIAPVSPFGHPRPHFRGSLEDASCVFGRWNVIQEGVEPPDDALVVHLSDEGILLWQSLPEPLRDWACGWAFSLRALSVGLHWASSPPALEQPPIAAAIEPAEFGPDQVDLEKWFRLPFEKLDQDLANAFRLDQILSRPAVLVQGMAYMAKGSEDRLIGLLSEGLRAPITPELLSLALAHRLALVARLWFGKPLHEMYANALRGHLEDLRAVIRVCPSSIGFPSLAQSIRTRLLVGDDGLARTLSNALANPLTGVERFELELNHALTMMLHSGSLSRLNDAAAQFIFLECQPPLCPDDGEDPVGSLLRRIRRFKREGRTIAPEDLSSAGD